MLVKESVFSHYFFFDCFCCFMSLCSHLTPWWFDMIWVSSSSSPPWALCHSCSQTIITNFLLFLPACCCPTQYPGLPSLSSPSLYVSPLCRGSSQFQILRFKMTTHVFLHLSVSVAGKLQHRPVSLSPVLWSSWPRPVVGASQDRWETTRLPEGEAWHHKQSHFNQAVL